MEMYLEGYLREKHLMGYRSSLVHYHLKGENGLPDGDLASRSLYIPMLPWKVLARRVNVRTQVKPRATTLI
jgi:hypothetical protein